MRAFHSVYLHCCTPAVIEALQRGCCHWSTAACLLLLKHCCMYTAMQGHLNSRRTKKGLLSGPATLESCQLSTEKVLNLLPTPPPYGMNQQHQRSASPRPSHTSSSRSSSRRSCNSLLPHASRKEGQTVGGPVNDSDGVVGGCGEVEGCVLGSRP